MAYEFTGKLSEVFPTQELTASFKKREFVLEKSETSNDRVFTDQVKFQVTQDRCAQLDNYAIGDMLKVTFNIKGSKWEKDGRSGYFVNLDAWRIEKTSDNNSSNQENSISNGNTSLPEVEDDLPF
ncbi:MAG: DUF3127 domain-containing protein [Chitinophagales bacterium]